MAEEKRKSPHPVRADVRYKRLVKAIRDRLDELIAGLPAWQRAVDLADTKGLDPVPLIAEVTRSETLIAEYRRFLDVFS